MLIAITIATELPCFPPQRKLVKIIHEKNENGKTPFRGSGNGSQGRQPMTKHLFMEMYHNC